MRKIWAAAVVGAVMLAGGLGAGVGAVGATAVEHGAGAAGGGFFRNFVSGQLGRLMTLKAELNLTEEQKGQIRTIVMGHREEIAKVLRPVAEDRRALRDLTLAETPDEGAIRAAAAKFGTSVGDAAVLASTIKGEVRKVLTPAQQQKLQEFRKASDGAVDQMIDSMGKAL